VNRSVYTIGHSNHTAERFTELLAEHEITALADVRSHPHSRFNPQFNREGFAAYLRKQHIAYVFLGRELGARSDDPSCYVDGKVNYDLLARTPLFQQGLDRIAQGASEYRVALMCAEKDPLTCHRAILVARHLASRHFDVTHILEDGSLEGHEQSLARLLQELNLDQSELFLGHEDLISKAYSVRGEQIAYTKVSSPLEPSVD
jgi:uncharacterized protein (DUF488 family)